MTRVFAFRAAIVAAFCGLMATNAVSQSEAVSGSAVPEAPLTVTDAPISTSQVTPPTQNQAIDAAPEAAEAIEHVDVIVEGERFSVRVKRTDTQSPLIEATPIFTQLKGVASYEGAVLSYRRFQDGAQISIDFNDGKVRANGSLIGGLPQYEETDQANDWLSLNEISILTGTILTKTEGDIWTFTLDKRLRPQFDLDLFVEGTLVQTVENEPRTIGPVLLLPLEPISDALGHTLSVSEGVVSVTRLHDGAELSLNLGNGLVSVNGIPRGVTPNIAYIDPELLLLPAAAIETLTGTHVTLAPGSSRIDVELDERLGGGALPGERVLAEGSATGPVVESLAFRLSDIGPQTVELTSHVGKYNTRLRYESVGGFANPEELQPGFIGAEIQSLDGWVAGIGDQTTQFRELSGVGQGRIRGASWRKRQPSGAVIAVAAGLAVQGSEQINERVARPVYGGFVGGGRLISADGQTEYGLSFSVEDERSNVTEIVASYRKRIEFDKPRDEAGLRRIQVQADAGVFIGNDETRFDGRIRADVNYDLSDRAGINASVDYTGGSFVGNGGFGDTDPDQIDENPDAPSPGGGERLLASVSADWHARDRVGPIGGLALGARAAYSRTDDRRAVTVSASANGQIINTGVDFTLDTRLANTQSAGLSQNTLRTRVAARKSFKWADLQATYNVSSVSGGETTHNLVTTVSTRGWYREFNDNGAYISATPNASLVVTSNETNFRAGATVSAGTGSLFGDRFSLTGQVSALQSVATSNENVNNFFASAQARYRLFRNIELTANYFDNFGDQRDVTVGLTGRINFNPPRKYAKPQEGRGVLTGQVFFDRNRDGIRQDDEPGIGGAGVRVLGTRLSLRADRNGYYTIQNLPANLYDLGLSLDTLPLGFLPQSDFVGRATIGADRVTRLDIPVAASGQIRGTLFADSDLSGAVDPGEERFEGVRIKLTRLDQNVPEVTQYTVSFGQFSFENVIPGEYSIAAYVGGAWIERKLIVGEDELFQLLPFGLDRAELGLDTVQQVEIAPVEGEA